MFGINILTLRYLYINKENVSDMVKFILCENKMPHTPETRSRQASDRTGKEENERISAFILKF